MNNRYFIKLDAVDNEYSLYESPRESKCWGRLLDEYGFLMEDSYNSELIDIEKLKNLPGAIIVAEAGMGKSYITKEIMNIIPEDECMYIEPCLFTSNPQALETEFAQSNWQYLLVDGLDENPNIVSILIRNFTSYVNGKHIFLTSRSIQQLKPLHERLNLPVYILLPFSENTVRQIAQDEEIEGNQFLFCVKQKNLSNICANPLGCKHLMKIFKKGTLANTTNEQLWVTAILELCSENGSDTYDLKMKEDIVTKQNCYDMATKIAIVLKLTGESLIQRIGETETDGNPVDFSRFFSRNEWGIFNSILHRAIFTPVDNNTFRFSHKSYYDYFASVGLQEYVPEHTWMSIVCSPNGEAIYPQWEDVVAWLATQNQNWLNYLLDKQPELLLLSDSLINSVGTATLCKSLLGRSNDLDYWSLNKATLLQRLHCLKSSGIIPILRSSLAKEANNSEREMAIIIVRECRMNELEEELVAIFCNTNEEHSLRVSAGYTLIEIASVSSREECKAILSDEHSSSDLIGLLLQMTWPKSISIEEFWPYIANFNKHCMDSLWIWLEFDFPNSLPSLSEDKVFEILKWLVNNVDFKSNEDRKKTMLRQTLTICWNLYCSPERYEIIGRGILLFTQHYEYPFFENSIHDVPRDICCSSEDFATAIEQRRELAKRMIDLSDINGDEITNISCPILDKNDISFLFEQILSSLESVLQRKWCFCLKSIQGLIPLPEQSESWNQVHSLFPDVLQYDAEQEIILREKSSQEWEKHLNELRIKKERNEQKKQLACKDKINLVKQFLASGQAYLNFNFIANTIVGIDNHISFDYPNSKVWLSLSDLEKQSLIIESKTYLQNSATVLKSGVITPTSILALHLLERSAQNDFRMLSDNVIDKHLSELFSWLECDKHQSELSSLLQAIVTYFPIVFKKHLLLWLDNSMQEGRFPSLSIIKSVITPDVLNDIIDHIEHMKISDKMEFLVLNEIKKHSMDLVKEYASRKFSSLPNDISCMGHRFSIFVLDYMPEMIVDLVQKLKEKPAWGKEWLEDVIHVHVYQYPLLPVFSKTQIETLTDFYIWLHHNYPAENDPKHVVAFTPNTYDMIYRFILDIFNSIVNYPSNNTEHAIQRISDTFPNDLWLHDWIKRAKYKDLSKNAVFYSEDAIYQLITNKNSIIINSPDDILAVVVEAINAYQLYLTGTQSPRVEDLWNNINNVDIKPKHEEDFSDHLKSYLTFYFKNEHIIINREVQLNRGRNGEAGSRTDIWIDAFEDSTNQRISLCIEVKGSWNASAKTAMNDQLIAKYMNNDGADAGILLIGWFQSKQCPQKGNIWNDDRSKAKEEILKQEQQARNNGLTIKGMVIDCDYRI